MNIYKVVHLVPYDGIGGVETAARTMINVKEDDFIFKVKYIYPFVSKQKHFKSLYNPFKLISFVWHFRKFQMDVLIVSLWRSAIIGIIYKIMHPKIKLITFLHSNKYFHLFDYIFHRVSICFSYQIWSDSLTTARSRLSLSEQHRCRVISFVTHRILPLPERHVSPVFIFWGRIDRLKGLSRAILIFAEIKKRHPLARFIIIGPDGGSLSKNKNKCISLGLTESVIFKGSANLDEIKTYSSEASFYLQTSLIEGMAMSVVEAMQLGLVPIVTPVGEIISYCKNGHNSIIIDSDSAAIDLVLRLIDSNIQYQEIRKMAIETWQDKIIYKDSVVNACKNITKDIR